MRAEVKLNLSDSEIFIVDRKKITTKTEALMYVELASQIFNKIKIHESIKEQNKKLASVAERIAVIEDVLNQATSLNDSEFYVYFEHLHTSNLNVYEYIEYMLSFGVRALFEEEGAPIAWSCLLECSYIFGVLDRVLPRILHQENQEAKNKAEKEYVKSQAEIQHAILSDLGKEGWIVKKATDPKTIAQQKAWDEIYIDYCEYRNKPNRESATQFALAMIKKYPVFTNPATISNRISKYFVSRYEKEYIAKHWNQ